MWTGGRKRFCTQYGYKNDTSSFIVCTLRRVKKNITNKHKELSIDMKRIFVYGKTNNNTSVYAETVYLYLCMHWNRKKMWYNIITNLANNVCNIICFVIWWRYTRGWCNLSFGLLEVSSSHRPSDPLGMHCWDKQRALRDLTLLPEYNVGFRRK